MFRKLAVTVVALAAMLVSGGIASAATTASTSDASPAAGSIIEVTSDNYQQVMKMSDDKPVVLDFYADWCHWCQQEIPYLQKYNTADNGKWVWAKVNVDDNQKIAQQYGVNGIPDLVQVRNGDETGSRFQGFDPKSGPSQLRSWLNDLQY